jgi:hypothetical protein
VHKLHAASSRVVAIQDAELQILSSQHGAWGGTAWNRFSSIKVLAVSLAWHRCIAPALDGNTHTVVEVVTRGAYLTGHTAHVEHGGVVVCIQEGVLLTGRSAR